MAHSQQAAIIAHREIWPAGPQVRDARIEASTSVLRNLKRHGRRHSASDHPRIPVAASMVVLQELRMRAHHSILDAQTRRDDPIAETASPEEIVEAASLLSRLQHRSKMDPLMCRAARHLLQDPTRSVRDLAAQLSASEDYVSRCLRSVLGADPDRLAHIARKARPRATVHCLTRPRGRK